MTEESKGAGAESVGSVGEEAAKLFSALSGVAKEHLGTGDDSTGGGSQAPFSAESLSASITESLHNINDHLATGGEDCRYCPVCQVIHAVRQTSPEVKAHLASAATSLLQAAAGALATQVAPHKPGAPVEKIDLDDEAGWDDES